MNVPATDDATSVKKMFHSIPLFGLTKKKSGTYAATSPHTSSPLGSNVVHDFRNLWELSNKKSQPYRIRRSLTQPLHHCLTKTPWSPSLNLKSTILRDLHPHPRLYGNSCLVSSCPTSSRICSPDQDPTKSSRHCPQPQLHQLACHDIPWKNCCECSNRMLMGFRRQFFTSKHIWLLKGRTAPYEAVSNQFHWGSLIVCSYTSSIVIPLHIYLLIYASTASWVDKNNFSVRKVLL
jgi:hypothetical protein